MPNESYTEKKGKEKRVFPPPHSLTIPTVESGASGSIYVTDKSLDGKYL